MNVQIEPTLSAGCTPGERAREWERQKEEKGGERVVR